MSNQMNNSKDKTAIVLLPVSYPSLPPLGLAMLKGYLSLYNIDVKVLDFNNYFFRNVSGDLRKQWLKSCSKTLEENIYDILQTDYKELFDIMIRELLVYHILGFSCYSRNLRMTLKVAERLKYVAPEKRIVLGGPEVTLKYLVLKDSIIDYFGSFVDHFVIGEGEEALKMVLSSKDVDRVLPFLELQKLENLSVPDFGDFDLSGYPKAHSIPILLSRGCIFECRFCSERLLFKRFKTYAVKDIISLISYHRQRGISNFIFYDSLINGDISLLKSMCDSIIKEFGSVKWEAQLAIRRDMPIEILERMKQSGCYHLFVGLESGCDSTLRRMGKGFTTMDAVDFFRKLRSVNLSFGVSLIIGYPGETDQDIRESLDFLIRYRHLIPKIEQINPYVYYDGINSSPEDYRKNKRLITKTNRFIEQLIKKGFKYTKAYLMNLVEDDGYS